MAVTEFAIHLLISETIEVISPERLVTLRNYTHPVIWRILSRRGVRCLGLEVAQ